MNLREAMERAIAGLDFGKRIFCGFSANVDVIANVGGDDFLRFQENTGCRSERVEQPPKPPLTSKKEVMNYAGWFMARGKGCDAYCRNLASLAGLMRLPGNRRAIGGTGAQAANWLAHAGFRNVNLSVPYRSAELDAVLDPGIAIFDNNTGYRAELPENGAFPDIHCIIDYAAGTRVRFDDGGVDEAPAPNRAMFSQDICCARLTMAPGFKSAVAEEGDGASLLTSGFSTSTTHEGFTAFVEENAGLLAAARSRLGGRLFAHLEECHMWGETERRRRLVFERVYPVVDSVGMNEEELAEIAHTLGLQAGAGTVALLRGIAGRFNLDRVCVHAARVAVTVTRRDPDRERDALAMGVLMSSARAHFGEFVKAERLFGLPRLLSGIAGERQVPRPIDLGDGYSAVEVPTLYGMTLRASIGLGDAFTGGVVGVL